MQDSTDIAELLDSPWKQCFNVDDNTNLGLIQLAQIDETSFQLKSEIEYIGVTGLEHRGLSDEMMRDIRRVSPAMLNKTDIASVPSWFRWFTGTYGVYTPAALVHDRLIKSRRGTAVEGLSAQDADRYFRFMLHGLGVSFARRWLMWSAVALRTRFFDGFLRKFSVILWMLLALAGTTGFIFGSVTNDWLVVGVAALAPIPASLLWGRQAGAGLIAAYLGFPWVVPPAIFIGLFYCIYLAVEKILAAFDSPLNKPDNI